MARKRPYVIIGCFVAGMLLTPPDVISQLLLALPAWLLFEFGVVMARLGQGSVKMPLDFQAFHRGKAIGKTVRVVLRHRDMLLMSQKATGHDWLRSSIIAWRHAAGKKAAWRPKKHGPEPKVVVLDV